jgi:hypothetical protein
MESGMFQRSGKKIAILFWKMRYMAHVERVEGKR